MGFLWEIEYVWQWSLMLRVSNCFQMLIYEELQKGHCSKGSFSFQVESRVASTVLQWCFNGGLRRMKGVVLSSSYILRKVYHSQYS